jgi:hypothetical protein
MQCSGLLWAALAITGANAELTAVQEIEQLIQELAQSACRLNHLTDNSGL